MNAPRLFYIQQPKNIIPRDGEAIYHGPIVDWQKATEYFERIMATVHFHSEERIMYGKHIVTKRKIAWFDRKRTWPKVLLEIKKEVERVAQVKYTSCLVNLYEDGSCGLGWHNDKEAISEHSSIASISFGEERRFDIRYIGTKETYSVELEHGALLIMQGIMQKYWEHHIPKSKRVLGSRINITFRQPDKVSL